MPADVTQLGLKGRTRSLGVEDAQALEQVVVGLQGGEAGQAGVGGDREAPAKSRRRVVRGRDVAYLPASINSANAGRVSSNGVLGWS